MFHSKIPLKKDSKVNLSSYNYYLTIMLYLRFLARLRNRSISYILVIGRVSLLVMFIIYL